MKGEVYMRITMDEYLRNPNGRGAVMPGLVALKADYDNRFNQLMETKPGSFKITMYSDKNVLYAHMKIPSESYDSIAYDVVIRFTKDRSSSDDIATWSMSMFSNAPSFVFTYTYTYRKYDIGIRELSAYLDKRALTDRPKIKNPYGMLGPDKSIYFALKYISKSPDITQVILNAKKLSLRELGKNIVLFSGIMTKIDIEKKKKRNENDDTKKLTKQVLTNIKFEPMDITMKPRSHVLQTPVLTAINPLNRSKNKVVRTPRVPKIH